MQRKAIDYKDILSMFLPKEMLDYFDFTDYSDMGEYYGSTDKLSCFHLFDKIFISLP